VQIFLDGYHLFSGARSLNKKINYTKLIDILVTEDEKCHKLRFYAEADESSEPQQKFLGWLRMNGFLVITSPVKFATGENEKTRHANMALMIATDMILAAHSGEKEFILVSGAGELAYTVRKLSDMGCRVDLASFRNSTYGELASVCDEIMDLSTCAEVLSNRGVTE